MPKKKKTNPQLLVIFDTNVLFTQVASDLVRKEISTLIDENSSHTDIDIRWFLPSVVVDERRYQMRNKAFNLLPSIQKLERLLGHNLNITEDILIQRVNEAVNNSISDLNINELVVDTKDVDWEVLIQRACFREPPFEAGEKEKGFRDSIIAEAVFQLLKISPSTPAICRLVLVTDDSVLTEFVEQSTSNAKNMRVLSNINDLESLINTLVSSVTEDFVDEIKEIAGKYFFEKGNETSYYYKENISSKISEKYSEELKATPSASIKRKNSQWWINPPVFVKKDKQRVHWFTQVEIDCKFYRYEHNRTNELLQQPSSIGGLGGLGGISGLGDIGNVGAIGGLSGLGALQDNVLSNRNALLSAGLMDAPTKIETGEGKSFFEIHWSVNVTPTKKLTRPKLESINFIKNDWTD